MLLMLTTWTARSNAVRPGTVVEREGRGMRGGERERTAAFAVGEGGVCLCVLIDLLRCSANLFFLFLFK